VDSEKKVHTLHGKSIDDDAIRDFWISRCPSGNTEFTIKTTFPDRSDPVVFQILLTPRAVEIMHGALDIGMKDVADWPKPQDTTAPAPGQEGGK